MPMSDYVKQLRARVGHDLLLFPSASAIIFNPAGQVLLLKHSNNQVWVAPGGSIEPGESPADAVVREAWEESGLHVEPIRIVGIYGGPTYEVLYANGDLVSYVMVAFECRVLGGQLRADGVETLEAGYFAESDLPRLKLADWVMPVLSDALKREQQAWFAKGTWRPPEN